MNKYGLLFVNLETTQMHWLYLSAQPAISNRNKKKPPNKSNPVITIAASVFDSSIDSTRATPVCIRNSSFSSSSSASFGLFESVFIRDSMPVFTYVSRQYAFTVWIPWFSQSNSIIVNSWRCNCAEACLSDQTLSRGIFEWTCEAENSSNQLLGFSSNGVNMLFRVLI